MTTQLIIRGQRPGFVSVSDRVFVGVQYVSVYVSVYVNG